MIKNYIYALGLLLAFSACAGTQNQQQSAMINQAVKLDLELLRQLEFVNEKMVDDVLQERSVLKISNKTCQLHMMPGKNAVNAISPKMYEGDVVSQGEYVSVRLDKLDGKILNNPVVYNFRSYEVEQNGQKYLVISNVTNGEIWQLQR